MTLDLSYHCLGYTTEIPICRILFHRAVVEWRILEREILAH
jgi:hypothetical protein